jgi:hypothetical protein
MESDFNSLINSAAEKSSDQPFSLFGFQEPENEPQGQPAGSETVPYIGSDEVPTPATIIGEYVSQQEMDQVLKELDWRQRQNILLTARGQFVAGEPLTAQAISQVWPVGLNHNNTVAKFVTDPEERGKVFRAGFKPTVAQIQIYMQTPEYREGMKEFGIEIDPNDTGLTAEQHGFLTILTNVADGRDLKRKLSAAGISWSKFQVWLKQPLFAYRWNKLAGETLKEAVPHAQIQLAAKMTQGDLSAIKLGFEITGFHDPNGKKQIDAEAFVGVILEVIEDSIKDPELLKEIATKIQLRGTKALGG